MYRDIVKTTNFEIVFTTFSNYLSNLYYVNIEQETCAILNCDNTKSSAMMTFIMYIITLKYIKTQ